MGQAMVGPAVPVSHRGAASRVAGMQDDLAQSLRAWRERLAPEDAGPGRSRTRTPGLRREEVALTAGISVNYLTRLEQGRMSTPSVSVIGALARALQLDPAESSHLHQLAGHA
jgi:transcriptional regulator with XRE-family HTH domain